MRKYGNQKDAKPNLDRNRYHALNLTNLAAGSKQTVEFRVFSGSLNTTTLITTMAGYNYVEFIMELNSESHDVEDGRMVLCKVRDLHGELLVRNRRMVMVRDSEVEKKTRGKPIGTRVHVLGLPRINLSLVSWRLKAAKEGRTEVLTWSLPYEIIVAGFYKFVVDEENVADNAPPSPRGSWWCGAASRCRLARRMQVRTSAASQANCPA